MFDQMLDDEELQKRRLANGQEDGMEPVQLASALSMQAKPISAVAKDSDAPVAKAAPAPTVPMTDRSPSGAPSLGDFSAKLKAAFTKEHLSDISGVPEKDIDDNTLRQVSSKLRGASVVASQGGDPRALPQTELSKLDPTGEPKKAPEKEADPEEMSNQKKLMLALTAAVPTILGYAFGGYQGGAIGAQAGGQAVKEIGEHDEKLAERKIARADKKVEQDAKAHAQANEDRKIEILDAQRQGEDENRRTQRAQGDRKLNLEERKMLNDYELQRMNLSQTAPGKQLAAEQADKLAGHENALTIANDLRTAVAGNADKFGPVVGYKTMLPYGATESKALQAQFDAAAQNIGKSMEGGKLTDQDILRYKKMVPTVHDTPEVAMAKIDLIERQIKQRQKADIETFAKAGSNVAQFKTQNANQLVTSGDQKQAAKKYFGPKDAVADEMPDFHSMSKDELNAYLKKGSH